MCVFVSKCQWFPSSAFVLLAGCRVVLEVKVNVVVVVSVVAMNERRLSEVPWKLVWSQFLVIPVVTTCPLTASSMITCGVLLVFVTV